MLTDNDLVIQICIDVAGHCVPAPVRAAVMRQKIKGRPVLKFLVHICPVLSWHLSKAWLTCFFEKVTEASHWLLKCHHQS